MNSIEKKLVTGICVSVILVSCSTALAAGKHDSGDKAKGGGNSNHSRNTETVVQSEVTSQEIETPAPDAAQTETNAVQNNNEQKSGKDKQNKGKGQEISREARYKNIPVNHNNVGALKKVSAYLEIVTAGLKPSEISDKLAQAVDTLTSDALSALAEKLKIDTTDMTEEQIVAAIKEKLTPPGNLRREKDRMNEIAEYLDIDISDMSPEEIADAINAAVDTLDSDGLSALAEKLNIDTTDMTEEQIIAAIKEKLAPNTDSNTTILTDIAEYLNVDITGLSSEEAAGAINTAVQALDSEGLSALAEKLQLDITDMTNEEIIAAIEEKLAPIAEEDGGVLSDMAEYLNLDITGLAPEEAAGSIKTAVEALDTVGLHALAENLQIDTTDMTDADIVSAIEALLTPPQTDTTTNS